MNFKPPLLLATAIVGTLTLTAFAPAFAHDAPGKGQRYQQRDRMADRGGMRGEMRGAPGGFIHLMCSEDGAQRLETALGNIGERITLTDEQQALLDDLKTVALTAQTEFADNCTVPARDGETDPVEGIKARQDNMKAQIAAMDEVIPALEAFHDSLTDEQKAELKPSPRDRNDQRRGGKGRMHGKGRG